MSRYISENTRLRTFPLLSSGIYKLLYGFIPLPYRGLFGKGDITHFFNFLIPPGVKGYKVCTIHDFAFIRYPETVTLRTRKMLQYQLGKTIKRADLIFVNSRFTEKELKEAACMEVFLPAQLSEQELEAELKDIIAQTGVSKPSDMGKVMGVATKKLAGRADGKAISQAVKRLLS